MGSERRGAAHPVSATTRVWDFFIAASFLSDPDLWQRYLDDARFRGAYLRIAETWPLGAAKRVRDRLVVAAAKSGDHTTSDEFLKRLDVRDPTDLRADLLPRLEPAQT